MSNNLKNRKQNIQKKVNNLDKNMCANLEEEMRLLTVWWLQNLSIKIEFLSILREIF